MLVIKSTVNSNLRMRVDRQSFDSSSNTFHHLDGMIGGRKPIKEKPIYRKGRKIGIEYHYEVRGSLPKYGASIASRLSKDLKNKLYGLCTK